MKKNKMQSLEKQKLPERQSSESAKNYEKKYRHIPWKAIAGMRDKLIHDYINVDLDMVWETATKDVPLLIPQIQAIIDDLEKK